VLHPEAFVEEVDAAEVLLEADGAVLDLAPAEIDPERPKDRSIPAARFSAAGFRVSLSRRLVLQTHPSESSRGNSGQNGSDKQSGTHDECGSTMERRMGWIDTHENQPAFELAGLE